MVEGPELSLALYGLEFSLDTAALDELELVARTVTKVQVRDWFSRSADTEEVALLSTCHRIELTLVARSPEALEQWRAVLPGGRESWRLREDVTLVHHLFRVAAGRESLAVGEAEVGQQVRIAGRSVESRHPRALLRELFRAAADAAQEVAPAPRNAPSIAAVAAARLREIVTAPTPHVVVVGSGTVGHQVVESLSSSTRLTVVYHQRPPEEAFLRSHGARAVPLERLPEALGGADAVITAAKFGNHGLRAADLPRDRPLLLVDLGMPRNIDPDVRTLPNVRLLDLEELHEQPRGSLDIAGGDLRLEELAQEFADRLAPLLLEPWIDAYRRAAEALRRAELANARSFLGELDPEQELAVERLTQRLVARLLAAPTERLRSLPIGPEGELQRRWAVDLLSPRPDDP
ncbi:MAG: hypothetical protein WB947_04185 [Thermoplasmata archaeon]